ncbi:uncharacterized protein METZ01_LOCUS241345, partial [marine metagenome]
SAPRGTSSRTTLGFLRHLQKFFLTFNVISSIMFFMPVDHTVSQFSLVDAPNSWPAINSLPGLTVYPGEIIYFDVKYAPAENNPPFEVWIITPSGANEQGTTVPGEAYLGANSSILGTGSYWQSTRGVFAWRNS